MSQNWNLPADMNSSFMPTKPISSFLCVWICLKKFNEKSRKRNTHFFSRKSRRELSGNSKNRISNKTCCMKEAIFLQLQFCQIFNKFAGIFNVFKFRKAYFLSSRIFLLDDEILFFNSSIFIIHYFYNAFD